MNIIKAHAREGFYFDNTANSDKFYVVIQAGPYTIFNNGRRGGPIGQIQQVKKHASEAVARAAADKKWDDKTGSRAHDRYGNPEFTDFDIDLDRLREDKASGAEVVTVYRAANRATPPEQPVSSGV